MVRYAELIEGRTYRNLNGRDYLCGQVLPHGDGTILERATDGWTLNAHGITLYDDGSIEWDYSTGGHWPKAKGANMNKYICEKCGAVSYSAASPESLRDSICLVKGCGGTVRPAEEGTAKQAPAFTPEQEKRIAEIVRATLKEPQGMGKELTEDERAKTNQACREFRQQCGHVWDDKVPGVPG